MIETYGQMWERIEAMIDDKRERARRGDSQGFPWDEGRLEAIREIVRAETPYGWSWWCRDRADVARTMWNIHGVQICT